GAGPRGELDGGAEEARDEPALDRVGGPILVVRVTTLIHGVGDDGSVPSPQTTVPPRRLSGEVIRYALASAFSFVWILASSALCVEVLGWTEQVGVAVALFSALLINF